MVESFWMIAKILHRAKQEKRDDNAVIFFLCQIGTWQWESWCCQLEIQVLELQLFLFLIKKKTKKKT